MGLNWFQWAPLTVPQPDLWPTGAECEGAAPHFLLTSSTQNQQPLGRSPCPCQPPHKYDPDMAGIPYAGVAVAADKFEHKEMSGW